jgi:hypothetical protein
MLEHEVYNINQGLKLRGCYMMDMSLSQLSGRMLGHMETVFSDPMDCESLAQPLLPRHVPTAPVIPMTGHAEVVDIDPVAGLEGRPSSVHVFPATAPLTFETMDEARGGFLTSSGSPAHGVEDVQAQQACGSHPESQPMQPSQANGPSSPPPQQISPRLARDLPLNSPEDSEPPAAAEVVTAFIQEVATSLPSPVVLTPTPRRRVKGPGMASGLPRRSARVAAQGRSSVSNPEIQARNVLMRKLKVVPPNSTSDAAAIQAYNGLFRSPLSSIQRKAIRALFTAATQQRQVAPVGAEP